ncbi:winged helix-turn-helix domain-containing protein [Streptomyces sp. SAI-041]|uniref:ArsR/SmtB family transcription factor n=1 Tax=Streptomyces sp. SAI-041 TaxID=2940548 RepID=UPI0024735942|nr:winged helix-turn-helix domain-containing protein [Streptomyces sp. SAI-041]MDH6554677.1 DNA-binding transcriptional ArsR family regulator [Streptomyces sp. SAI-041]
MPQAAEGDLVLDLDPVEQVLDAAVAGHVSVVLPVARDPRTSTPLPLPSLDKVFAVLGDEIRPAIVQLLLDGEQPTVGEIAERVWLPASTCWYHLSKPLNAGITVRKADGTLRPPVLRREAFDGRLPGLLALIRQGASCPRGTFPPRVRSPKETIG